MYKNLIATALILFAPAINAQLIERFAIRANASDSSGAPIEVKGYILVSPNGSRDESCGVSVDFGDALPARIMEVQINQKTEFTYKYTKPGVFVVSVKGERVNRFLNGLAACEGQGIQVVGVLDPAQLEDGSLDLVMMARTKPSRTSGKPYFANNLDGSAKLIDSRSPLCLNTTLLRAAAFRNNDADIINEIHDAQQFGILASHDFYKQAGLADIHHNAIDFYEKSLQASGHKNNQNCNYIYDSRNFDYLASLFQRAEVIAVPRWLLPSLKKVRSLSGIQDYSPWITLTVQQAKQISFEAQQKTQENTQLLSKFASEMSALAEANSKEKVGSLIIGHGNMRSRNRPQALNVCTLVNQDQDGAAVSGYLGQNLNMLLPAMREQYQQAGWGIDKKFNAVFKDINDAFIGISRQPDSCHIFVDFPKNLAALDAGIKQNKTLTSSLGMLIESSTARDLFSAQRGYADYSTYLFARSITANPSDLKKLSSAGVSNKSEFDTLVDEMKRSKYANNQELSVVLSYISDRDRGISKKISAVAERDLRMAEEKLRNEKEETERQRKKEAFAREFPYEAIISCDFQGRHTNLASCFAGDVGTELEIKNGNNYRMYKSYELYQLGRERQGEGLLIPLSYNFQIKAQNASDNLVLSIKIREASTGNLTFSKSAAKYQVISVKN